MSRKDKYKSREELLKKVEVLRDETKEAYREMDKANSKLEKLEQRNEEMREMIDQTTSEHEREFAIGALIGAVAVLACLLVLMFVKWYFDAKFTPATDALEDAFISVDEEYQDGKHLFDFDGYMKKNGFKFDYQTVVDDDDTGYISRCYRKGDVFVRLEISLEYGKKYVLDSDMVVDEVTSEIWIDLDRGEPGPHYVAKWSSNLTDMSLNDFVHDDDSALFFHREALIALDDVLKSGNLKNEYSCPFEHLDIKHDVVNNAISSPHGD